MATQRIQRQIERLLDEAEQASAQRDWNAARDCAEHILTFDPENAEALAFLAAAERGLADGPPTGAKIEAGPQVKHPTSFADGRYQVKEFLGEGGKKRVYLAHDGALDREVALAAIKTEALDDTSRSRITREAQAMGRLGDHPHIMPIHDIGQEDGQPYMVLPYMQGGDVEGLIESAPDHRMPLEQVLEIARAVCRGLELAHFKGIVHRDLKPGNVWLTADGTPRVGDFGLALPMDVSRVTAEGTMVGTPAYMPPEQAMGGEMTPRADLYSLGAMLYEMVTGRPPFPGDDPIAVIGQHINTPPVAPSWLNTKCPKQLDALVMRLLAKNPNERPGSATEVLEALDAIDLEPGAQEAAQPQADTLEGIQGGVFVGRHEEMDRLRAAVDDAFSGRGGMVMLIGEPGIGKTRTAEELATYARIRGADVVLGRCYEDQGAPPFCPWRQAIGSYVQEHDRDTVRSNMGDGAASIADIVSDIRALIPDLPSLPPLEPADARFRQFESVSSFLTSTSRERPFVVILDNLQWADTDSLRLLEFLAPSLQRSRVLIVGTYREAELSRRHPLANTVGELAKETGFQRVVLRGLRREDVVRYVELVLRVQPPTGLANDLYRNTEGHPLFVNETVRLLAQEGQLSQETLAAKESWSLRIPQGLRAVVGRRLERLSEDCNRALTIAAVIGREFGLDQLERLVEGLSTEQLLEVLEEACAAQVIEELGTDVGRYQFAHTLVQQTLATELSTTRRVRLHARIAAELEELWGDSLEAHAAELAHHFNEAATVSGTEKLVRYSLMAGERALAAHAYEESLSLFQRALAAQEDQPKDSNTADLRFGLGRAQASLGLREAPENLTTAFEYYVGDRDLPRAIEVAEYPVGYGQIGVPELVIRALELVRKGSHEEGRLLSHYGYHLGAHDGDYQGARDALDRAMASARREKDTSLEMWTSARIGHMGMDYLRPPEECLEYNGRAIELSEALGDPRADAFCRICVVATHLGVGESAAADQHCDAMLAASESTRNMAVASMALTGKTRLAILRGDWGAAKDHIDRVLALTEGQMRLYPERAILAYQVGDFSEGEDHVERLLELTGRRPGVMRLILLLARFGGSNERLDVAEEIARSLPKDLSGLLPSYRRNNEIGLGLLAVQKNDPARAEAIYAALTQTAKDWPLDDNLVLSVERLLGLLADTLDKAEAAAGHFESAASFCQNAGYRTELAWCLSDYADLLLKRGEEGDREKANACLSECLDISQELGMRPLTERVLSRRELLRA